KRRHAGRGMDNFPKKVLEKIPAPVAIAVQIGLFVSHAAAVAAIKINNARAKFILRYFIGSNSATANWETSENHEEAQIISKPTRHIPNIIFGTTPLITATPNTTAERTAMKRNMLMNVETRFGSPRRD